MNAETAAQSPKKSIELIPARQLAGSKTKMNAPRMTNMSEPISSSHKTTALLIAWGPKDCKTHVFRRGSKLIALPLSIART